MTWFPILSWKLAYFCTTRLPTQLPSAGCRASELAGATAISPNATIHTAGRIRSIPVPRSFNPHMPRSFPSKRLLYHPRRGHKHRAHVLSLTITEAARVVLGKKERNPRLTQRMYVTWSSHWSG